MSSPIGSGHDGPRPLPTSSSSARRANRCRHPPTCSPRSPRSPTASLEPRADEGTAVSELMVRPEPVTETQVESLTEAPWAFLQPTRLVFPNGATVIYNVTDISDGDVAFAGRSLGGSSIVADDDVVDAMLAGEVVGVEWSRRARPGRARSLPRRRRRRGDGSDRPVHGGLLGSRRGARPRSALPAREPLHDPPACRPGRARQRGADVPAAHRGSRE